MATAVFGNTIGLGRDERTCYVYDNRRFCQTVLQTDRAMFGINAETCGSDLVLYGGFSSVGQQAFWYGTSASGPRNNWPWSAPNEYIYHITGNADSVYRNNILTALDTYQVTVTVGRFVNPLIETEGSLGVYFGTTLVGTITASGTYTFYGVAQDHFLRFAPSTDFDGYIDEITAYQVPTQMLAFLVDENGIPVSSGNLLTFVDGIFYFNLLYSSFEVADGCYTLCVSTACGYRYDNIVLNGAITGNANSWTLGANWSYSANNVCHAGVGAGPLEQSLSPWLLVNKSYRVTVTITGRTAGTLDVSIGGGTPNTLSTNAVHEFFLTTPDPLTHNGIKLQASATFDGCVDDISVSLRDTGWGSDICSGCLSLETTAPECTPQLSWTNDDAAFGLDYGNVLLSPALVSYIRLKSYLRLPEYDEDETEFRKSSGQIDKLYFRTDKSKELVIEFVPEYVADAISVGKGHDHFYIDGVEYEVKAGMEYELGTNPDSDLGMIKLRVRKKIVLMENKNC